MPPTYHPPVAQLLTLGMLVDLTPQAAEWPDYTALGLSAADIPELLQMALDDELFADEVGGATGYAPLHALRALGQLRAESAVEALLPLLDRVDREDDEWVQTELPSVFGLIGPAAVPGLQDFLADPDHGEWARAAAGEALVKVAEGFPETRDPAVAILTDRLSRFVARARLANAWLVAALCDLKAVESAAVIEQAFAADKVDLSVNGDWEEVQVELGLIQERVTPRPNFVALEYGPGMNVVPRDGKPQRHKADRKKKAKRKQSQASRRRNRKR